VENNRLIDKAPYRSDAEAKLASANPDLPAVCIRIISGYTPNPPTAIWPQVQQFTIDCAIAMKPRTPANARRLMTMIALFSTWVVTVAGCPVRADRIFTQSHIDRFVKGKLAGHSIAYRFDISRILAKIGQLLTGSTLTQLPTPKQGQAVRPHTAEDVARLFSWANSLSTPFKRQNARSLLALSAGAGLTSQQIMGAQVGDVEFRDSRAFVTLREPRERRVPVRASWVPTLIKAIGDRTSGDIFRAYRLEEYPPNQLQQFLSLNRGELRPSVARLRSGWIVSLINANLPLNVLLKVTGFTTPGSLRPYLRYAALNDDVDFLARITGEAHA
jgi:hypothetical protein